MRRRRHGHGHDRRAAELIRLVLVDIDGCLTDGEARPLNFDALDQIGDMNRRAREGGGPAITLCTGRPAPYVEVMQQAIDGYLPAIFESGCGLFTPKPYGFKAHPLITEEVQEAFREAEAKLREQLVRPGRAFFQLGKVFSASLYPVGISTDQLVDATCEVLGGAFCVENAITCINVTPAGVDKAAGATWLANEIGVQMQDVLAIGDSGVDLSVMARVGLAAAPANATDDVKAASAYVSPYATSRGVLDIIQHYASN